MGTYFYPLGNSAISKIGTASKPESIELSQKFHVQTTLKLIDVRETTPTFTSQIAMRLIHRLTFSTICWVFGWTDWTESQSNKFLGV